MADLGVEGWQLQCGEVEPDCVLDLRTESQFGRGRLASAQNVPYNRFQAEAESMTQGAGLILLVDEGGARAAEMAVWLGRPALHLGTALQPAHRLERGRLPPDPARLAPLGAAAQEP